MVEIPLSKGRVAIISNCDYERVSKHKWHAHLSRRAGVDKYYARGYVGGKNLYMHRFILGLVGEEVADHIDGDGLNNQRENLRICSGYENAQNRKQTRKRRSKHTGVTPVGKRSWRARITFNGDQIALGQFKTQEEAARAYDEAARKFHGAKAHQNYPEDNEPWL